MEKRYLIGYAWVSTEDQDLRLQIEALKRYGVPESRIITEKKSGATLHGRKLYDILSHGIGRGERLMVWKLDRLGRSMQELIQIVEMIEEAGADFVSITD